MTRKDSRVRAGIKRPRRSQKTRVVSKDPGGLKGLGRCQKIDEESKKEVSKDQGGVIRLGWSQKTREVSKD